MPWKRIGKWRYSSMIIDLAARWSDELHAPTALPHKERAPGSHWIRRWVDPRADLNAVEKRHEFKVKEN
jgi:hypothetical protein